MRLARALLASDCSQLKAENSPTPRDRAEPLAQRVPPPIPRPHFFFPTTVPFSPPCASRPGGSGSFLVFLQGGVLFGFLPSLLLPLPAPLGLPALR